MSEPTWQERVLRAYRRIREAERTEEVMGAEDFIRRELLKHGEELINSHAALLAACEAFCAAYCDWHDGKADAATLYDAVNLAREAIAATRKVHP